MTNFSFTCAYCNRPTTITNPNFDDNWNKIKITKPNLEYQHEVGLGYLVVACPNQECKKLTLTVRLTQNSDYYGDTESLALQTWQLLPASSGKPQPAYVPKAIVNDYQEACSIRLLSPKASAALARRCLQGMLRDFWKVKPAQLNLEIEEIKTKVTPAVWDAIDAVRSVGNIAAHMEKDVNIIIEIDPGEAELLIQLIEDLLRDWYVTRHERDDRLANIKAMAATKKSAKSVPKK